MSSHHRSDSECSFEFVKSDAETEVLLKEAKKEKEDVLSLKDEVSSESDASLSDSEEEDTKEESETAKVSEHLVGDSMGLTVEIPETDEILEKTTESSEKIMTEAPVAVDSEKAVADTATNTLQSDPLGVTESPILESVASLKEDNEKLVKAQTTLLTEVVVLRAEMERLKEIQANHARMISQAQLKQLERDQAERRKEEKRYSSIRSAICGEWRLVNLEGPNDNMKMDGFSFANRFKSLVAHTYYDYDGETLASHQRLFCKRFGHSTLHRGEERLNNGDIIVKTYLSGNKLITVWDYKRRERTESKERYVMDGQLYVTHTNYHGDKNTMIYERVKSQMECLASFGKASRFYLKFW